MNTTFFIKVESGKLLQMRLPFGIKIDVTKARVVTISAMAEGHARPPSIRSAIICGYCAIGCLAEKSCKEHGQRLLSLPRVAMIYFRPIYTPGKSPNKRNECSA